MKLENIMTVANQTLLNPNESFHSGQSQTKDIGSLIQTVNLSKQEANTWMLSRYEAKLNACKWAMIDFGFSNDWLRKWCKI